MKIKNKLLRLTLILWLLALFIFACSSLIPLIWPYGDSVTYLVYNDAQQKWDECHPNMPLRFFNSQACQASESQWEAFEE